VVFVNRTHIITGWWLALLLVLAAWATAPAHAEPFLDKLPFKLGFKIQEDPFTTRTGRYGRPLKPVQSMEYPNSRPIWNRHPYPGDMITLTFPF
jgi:hypothetical protein